MAECLGSELDFWRESRWTRTPCCPSCQMTWRALRLKQKPVKTRTLFFFVRWSTFVPYHEGPPRAQRRPEPVHMW